MAATPSASRRASSSSTGSPAVAGGDRGPDHVGRARRRGSRARVPTALHRLGAGDLGLEGALDAARETSRGISRAGHRQVADLAGRAGAALVQPAVDARSPGRRRGRPRSARSRRTPAAAPLCASATAARLTSLLEDDRRAAGRSRRSASRPRCQRGRSNANEISPVLGSTRPGVPSTTRRTVRHVACRPWSAACTTALCTTPTGSSVSLVDCSTRPITAPVMSAQAATTRSGADVHADHVGATRSDGVQLRVGPAAAGLLADPAHQAALLQPLDQLRGGDLAEAGHLAELRPGQRTAREQQLQRRAVVERAQQPGRAREAGGGHSWFP